LTGCFYTPVDCNDSDACTDDACDPINGCIYFITDCDDGDACTIDDCNSATGCFYAPVDCNDFDVCTIDDCDISDGCIYSDEANPPLITCPVDITICESQACVDQFYPVAIPSPVTLDYADRLITYTGVSINGGGNSAVVAPGSSVSLSYNLSVFFNYSTGYCPGCIVQSYIGIGGTSQILQCESSIYSGYTGSYTSGNFTAPTTPGIYYLKQRGTLHYFCQLMDFNNLSSNAIGVLVV
jgi:hypothetical protein